MISESILEGELVRLRPVQESDLPRFVEWLKDREVTRFLIISDDDPPTMEDETGWYESKRSDPDNVLWSVETLDGELLGNAELRITPQSKRGELGIGIQDKRAWGRGYGTDAVRLVLEYAFRDLRLNRVELTTDEDNTRAIRCYEKCGFVREGLMRRHRRVRGRYVNTVMMAILREEWTPSRPGVG